MPDKPARLPWTGGEGRASVGQASLLHGSSACPLTSQAHGSLDALHKAPSASRGALLLCACTASPLPLNACWRSLRCGHGCSGSGWA